MFFLQSKYFTFSIFLAFHSKTCAGHPIPIPNRQVCHSLHRCGQRPSDGGGRPVVGPCNAAEVLRHLAAPWQLWYQNLRFQALKNPVFRMSSNTISLHNPKHVVLFWKPTVVKPTIYQTTSRPNNFQVLHADALHVHQRWPLLGWCRRSLDGHRVALGLCLLYLRGVAWSWNKKIWGTQGPRWKLFFG